jgi:hypothetical protein
MPITARPAPDRWIQQGVPGGGSEKSCRLADAVKIGVFHGEGPGDHPPHTWAPVMQAGACWQYRYSSPVGTSLSWAAIWNTAVRGCVDDQIPLSRCCRP